MSHPEVLIALRRARDLTDRDFAQPLTLDSMAQAAHLSKFHFARAFTKAYGETPRTYLTRRRIERAKDLPDLNILLAHPQPPMFSEEDAATLLGLVAKGVMGAGVIETDDIKGAYEELKGKGVTFLQEPAERPYGIEALFRDDSGNWFSLNQHKRYGG